MAVLACSSRFSVLKIEDDDENESFNKKATNSSAANSAQGSKNKTSKTLSNEQKAKAKKKKKNAAEIAELQNLAFGSSKSGKQKGSSGHGKTVPATDKQWEEWKQKDTEFVSETYEQDLQEALILSKIDYEEKKDVYDAIQKEGEQNKLKKKKKSNQKKDKGVMSLDEFQNLGSNEHSSPPPKIDIPVAFDDSDFFDKIEKETSKIITKEHRHEQKKVIDPIQESARYHQFQEDLRLKDEEIAALNEIVSKLKEELKKTKMRNKKLYGILECGETREKAEILVQRDQLLAVKDELTEQLSEYHTALEQERSKVHALQMELKKCQNSKKQRVDSK